MKKRRVKKGRVALLGGAALLVIAAIAWFIGQSQKPAVVFYIDGKQADAVYARTVEYEAGLSQEAPSPRELKLSAVYKGKDVSDQLVLKEEKCAKTLLGTSAYRYQVEGIADSTFTYERTIVDTTPPQIEGVDHYTVQTGSAFTKDNLQIEVYDAFDIHILERLSLSDIDTRQSGVQEGTVTIADSSGNKREWKITVEVRDDAAPAEEGSAYFVQKYPEDQTILLNKTHRLEDGWEPNDLAAVSTPATHIGYLREEAAAAWEKLYAAAEKDGVAINIVSSFRTQQYQEDLFNSYLQSDPENAATYSAYPRTSEHELGLTLDISYDDLLHDDLQESALGKWMAENGYRYGWIVRYPQGKEAITQYIFEPWHYRYVGVELATLLQEKQWTLEEYYEQR